MVVHHETAHSTSQALISCTSCVCFSCVQDRKAHAALTGNLIDLSEEMDATEVRSLNAEAEEEERKADQKAAVAAKTAEVDRIAKHLVCVHE